MTNLFSSWQFWAVLSAVFAALTAILAKIGVEDVHPDLATFIRTVVILIVLAGLIQLTRGFPPLSSIPASSVWWLSLSGIATGASWLCYFRALKLGNAAHVASIDKMSVLLVAVFGVLFLGEKLSAQNWLGIALIALGALLVALR